MNNNLENAWNAFNQSQVLIKPKNNSNSNSNSNSGNINWTKARNNMNAIAYGTAVVPNENVLVFNMANYQMPDQEEFHVAKYVKDVYFTMFPENEGDVYPSFWINSVIGYYNQIRKERAKRLKSSPKDSLKGLKKHIIIACILRCFFVKNNVPVPVPVLMHYFNLALKRSQTKKTTAPFTIEQFEKYRTDARMGIKLALQKVLPECYNDIPAENLIDFTGFTICKFDRNAVFRTRRIAKHAALSDFADHTSPSIVAIGALFVTSVMLDKPVKYTLFGLTKAKLLDAYGKIVGSKNPLVIKEFTKKMPAVSLVSKMLQ